MPIRLGVVGLSTNGGWAANSLIPPIFARPLSDSFIITALSTTSPTSAAASAIHYGNLTKREVKAYHGSTEAISADPDVDVVVISVKVTEHAAAAMPAIKAGKDIFVEWPLGKNLAEAKVITQAAQERGVRTMVGLQSWQVPPFKKVQEWIEAGKIGRVISTSWYALKIPDIGFNKPFVTAGYDYTIDPENGATFLDISIAHNFSAVTRALGRFRTLSATVVAGFREIKIADALDSEDPRIIPSSLPDQWSISGVLESGALFSGTWLSLGKTLPVGQPSLVWEIVGTEGKIRIESDNPWTAVIPMSLPPEAVFLNGERISFVEENAAQTPSGRAWEMFAKGEPGSYPTFEDAVEIHRLVDAVKKSSAEGRTVDVSEL
ncbi:NAD-binding Rossmann fold oxidoreductase [Vararia minispora EC-137]|uniref:NAD-binding Rossmann fold oxidoreductase n=1 Tax=Vararia minispora EC-137 TaxID=1314806 RepID=A0ACB8Q9V3_9AGAM|nr:NAD-binding Rossmann fold oxidoreductase [Vararia minispora EC-137]